VGGVRWMMVIGERVVHREDVGPGGCIVGEIKLGILKRCRR